MKFWISSFYVVCIVFCFSLHVLIAPLFTVKERRRLIGLGHTRRKRLGSSMCHGPMLTDAFSVARSWWWRRWWPQGSRGKGGKARGNVGHLLSGHLPPTPHLPQHLPLENYRRGHLFPGPNPIPSITSNPILSWYELCNLIPTHYPKNPDPNPNLSRGDVVLRLGR